MIRITWSDTKSEYVVAREQVCWASLNAPLDMLTVYFTNGKSLEFEGKGAYLLHEALCNGIGHCTLEVGLLEGAE